MRNHSSCFFVTVLPFQSRSPTPYTPNSSPFSSCRFPSPGFPPKFLMRMLSIAPSCVSVLVLILLYAQEHLLTLSWFRKGASSSSHQYLPHHFFRSVCSPLRFVICTPCGRLAFGYCSPSRSLFGSSFSGSPPCVFQGLSFSLPILGRDALPSVQRFCLWLPRGSILSPPASPNKVFIFF